MTNISHLQSNPIPRAERLSSMLSKYWFLIFTAVFGLFAGLPFLAPVFMHFGWTGPGKVIYLIYSFLCHQLPQRSFFLFGAQPSYSLIEIQSAGVSTSNLLLLRQFLGTPEMGWKVAWSDRMVSMFTSILLFALACWPLRRRIPKLPWWGLALFLLPMMVDGTSHFFSDLTGIGQGFRDSNTWLALITNNRLPHGFYAGDALGSFNSWARLITGILFGLGLVWFGLPYVYEPFGSPARSQKTLMDHGKFNQMVQ